VNKAERIDEIARAAEISRSAAERAIDAVIASIKTSLRKDDPVTLVGFGSFYTTQRAAREGRNPRTGEAVSIGAARVPKFRAGKALKDALN
jgi:DNA-binding protein HU-beta